MKYGFIKSVIRSLKRKFGQPITLYKTTSIGTMDWTVGTVASRSVESKDIKRAIILPGRTTRKFSYDIGFLAANKNFTYGGFYDVTQREIIIERSDVGTFGLTLDYRVRFGESDYIIKELQEFEESQSYYLVVIKLKGQINEQ